jgi:diadenosine tetraphosphatase ApaH/serine/threonine PP2A family protein phosphatase
MPLFSNRKSSHSTKSSSSNENTNNNIVQEQLQRHHTNDTMSSTGNPYQQQISARDQEIARLQAQVQSLTNQLESAKQQQAAQRGSTTKRRPQMSPHAVHIQQVDADPRGKRSVIRAGRERMGRKASISTQQVMAALPSTDNDYVQHPVAIRVLDMFQNPGAHLKYLNSHDFAKDVFKLCQKVRHVLEREPRVVYLQSPCYIFGDIHGNLEDLHFFSDNIWRLGMSLTAGNFLFLGDYVDRGMSCLEVLAYLMAMKLQLPHKVYLLRGNHETRDVNGWEEHYGERSFIWQCRHRFGDDIGYRIWEACNQVFDRLPLAGVVDQDIFCVHGGIPRPIARNTTRIQDILNVPKVAGINPPYEHEEDAYQQVASDCIWSDPASEEQEAYSVDPNTGFGESLRGGGAICFGNKAVTDFLQQQGFSYIMRAHEAHAEGVAVSKQARVFTVFSTSKDHNQGSQALAGCILVDDEKLQVINRSPAYKNQYVHRRDSVSLRSLNQDEIIQRMNLGLITADQASEADDEEWQDMESEEEQEVEVVQEEPERYTFAQGRRSSINLQQMNENFHDSQVDWDAGAGTARNLFSGSNPGSMEFTASMAAMTGGSSRDLDGLIREVVKENEDDEDSTVDGDDIEDKEMEK